MDSFLKLKGQKMRKFLFMIFLSLSAANIFAESKRTFIDGIVVKVDEADRLILQSDVDAMVEDIKNGAVVPELIHPAKVTSDPKDQALQVLINESLIEQACKEQGISVDEGAIDRQVAKIIKANPSIADEAALGMALRMEGQTIEQFKQKLKKQLIFVKFRQRYIQPYVKVTRKGVEEYYLLKSGQQVKSLKVYLKKIEVVCEEQIEQGAECSEGKKKVNLAYDALKNGMEFDEVVKLYSADFNTRVDDYNLDELGSDELRQMIEEMKENDFTKPVRIGSSFYIFQLQAKEKATVVGFDEKAVKIQLMDELVSKEIISWLDKKRSKIHLPSKVEKEKLDK